MEDRPEQVEERRIGRARGYKASPETREKMRAAHRERWERNRERYLEAAKQMSDTKSGMSYLVPRRSHVVDQHGRVYESVEQVCSELGLKERLVRLCLERKRKSTGGFSFRLVSRRHEDYLIRRHSAEMEGAAMRLSAPQSEALALLASCPDGFAEPGKIWLDHSSYNNTRRALGQRNFGRVLDALQSQALVERCDNGYAITDLGRRVLAKD